MDKINEMWARIDGEEPLRTRQCIPAKPKKVVPFTIPFRAWRETHRAK